MAFLDQTAFQFALKQFYTPQKLAQLFYTANPALALLPKKTDWEGDVLPVPVQAVAPQGRSAVIANAITNVTATKGYKFLMKRVQDYGIAQIANETIKASQSNVGAFLKAATVEINNMLQELENSAAKAIFRNGSGSIGQVANSSFATAVLTLTSASDVVNFEIGQTLVTSATDGTGAVRGGTLVVLSVDRAAGTVTMTGNLSAGVAAIAQNDFIFVQGDYAAKLTGFAGWLPFTAPTGGDNFFGVDRSADTTRLAGIRVDMSGAPLEEAWIELISRIEREAGGGLDYGFCNHAQWRALEKALGSKVIYTNPKAEVADGVVVGFKGIEIAGQKGPVSIIADRFCPNTLAYGIQSNTWTLHSLGEMPSIFDTDGNQMLRDATTDSVVVRGYYYANAYCNKPVANGVMQLTAA